MVDRFSEEVSYYAEEAQTKAQSFAPYNKEMDPAFRNNNGLPAVHGMRRTGE